MNFITARIERLATLVFLLIAAGVFWPPDQYLANDHMSHQGARPDSRFQRLCRARGIPRDRLRGALAGDVAPPALRVAGAGARRLRFYQRLLVRRPGDRDPPLGHGDDQRPFRRLPDRTQRFRRACRALGQGLRGADRRRRAGGDRWRRRIGRDRRHQRDLCRRLARRLCRARTSSALACALDDHVLGLCVRYRGHGPRWLARGRRSRSAARRCSRSPDRRPRSSSWSPRPIPRCSRRCCGGAAGSGCWPRFTTLGVVGLAGVLVFAVDSAGDPRKRSGATRPSPTGPRSGTTPGSLSSAHKWLGYGFGSFWRAERGRGQRGLAADRVQWKAPHAPQCLARGRARPRRRRDGADRAELARCVLPRRPDR